MRIIVPLIIALLCAAPTTGEVPDVTADGGLTYQVVVDGEVVSEHRTQHKAQHKASQIEAENPDADTTYRINQVWRVESPHATNAPDNEPTPDPEPEPAPEPQMGFTDLDTAYAADRKVYVSDSEGDDSNDGLSSGAPKKTLSAAKALLRDGRADWLLLKAGDEWDEQIIGKIDESGPAADTPMVIGVYGSGARPVIDPISDQYALRDVKGHLVVQGIEVYNREQDPDHAQFDNGDRAYGIGRLNDDNNSGALLIEDCHLHYLADGVVADGQKGQSDNVVTLRRNIIVDCHDYGGRSQGVLSGNWQEVLYEENVFDHNGWHPTLAPRGDGSQFSHNVYTASSNTDNVTARRNITARASYNGMMMRSGGVAENNLSMRNPIGLLLKNGDQHYIRDNVITNVVDYQSGGGYIGGSPITLKPVSEGAVTGNIILDRLASNKLNAGITIWDTGFTGGGSVIPFEGNVVRGVTWDVDGAGININLPNAPNKTTTSGNIVDGNYGVKGDGESASLNDADRDIEDYMASIGRSGDGFEEFMESARSRARGEWDTDYTADAVNSYMRSGLSESGTDSTAPTESSMTVPEGGDRIRVVFSEPVTSGDDGRDDLTVSTDVSSAIGLSYSSGEGSSVWEWLTDRIINTSEVLTADYNQQGDGLQDSAGNVLAPFSDGSVTNNSTQTPSIESAAINAHGDELTVTINEPVTSYESVFNGFTLTVDGTELALTYSSGDTTSTLKYSIGAVVLSGQAVTLDYNRPDDGWQDIDEGALVDVADMAVTNNSTVQTDTTPPTLDSATMVSGTTLRTVWNEPVVLGDDGIDGLNLNTDGSPAITLSVLSGAGTQTLDLRMSREVIASETLTLDHAEQTDGLADAAGNQVATFSGESVANNVTASGQRAIVLTA